MSKEKKSKNELLQEKMFPERKNLWTTFTKAEQTKVFSFAKGYKKFMAESKTERLCTKNVIRDLVKAGYKNMNKVKSAKTGDKVFKVFKDKSVIAFIVGKDKEHMRIVGSHMDSPRLDLKPNPLYEDSNLALLQTHYYGGIKKYHWVNVPLSLIGVVFTKAGKKIEISIGEKHSEPKFIIPDLLPHLSKNQMERKTNEIIQGEELNILFGNIPVNDEKIKEQIKFAVMKKLHDDYGIIEEDFTVAELELVPSNMPIDVGIDKSMVAAYGQDDKVCVYTSLQALLETKNPKHTAVGFFVDKEEIGSVGDTGAASMILQNFAYDYAQLVKAKSTPVKILEISKSISADVTAAMDPNFKDTHDPQNSSFIGKGVAVEKYGGGGGKYSTNDAHSEFMQFMRNILDNHKIQWQTGELGKIDLGGGGTIGMFMSRYGMDCVDAGPAVLGMHAPYELTSKADVYSAYELYKAFFKS